LNGLVRRLAVEEPVVDVFELEQVGLAGVWAERPKPRAHAFDRGVEVRARHVVWAGERERVGIAEQPVDPLSCGEEFGEGEHQSRGAGDQRCERWVEVAAGTLVAADLHVEALTVESVAVGAREFA
jgi:hypothetical protein